MVIRQARKNLRQAEAGGSSLVEGLVWTIHIVEKEGVSETTSWGPGQLTLENSAWEELGLHCRCKAWCAVSISQVLRQAGHWAQDVALRSLRDCIC